MRLPELILHKYRGQIVVLASGLYFNIYLSLTIFSAIFFDAVHVLIAEVMKFAFWCSIIGMIAGMLICFYDSFIGRNPREHHKDFRVVLILLAINAAIIMGVALFAA